MLFSSDISRWERKRLKAGLASISGLPPLKELINTRIEEVGTADIDVVGDLPVGDDRSDPSFVEGGVATHAAPAATDPSKHLNYNDAVRRFRVKLD